MHLRTPFLFATLFAFLPISASAATLMPGDLIKSPTTSAIYYYGANGKRFVFPTEGTYASWHKDFSAVKTIPASDLAEIALGGNVTYRPGVKLIKVITDPKVYAVAQNGTLRWIQTETIAASLYGADWNKKIDDLPDSFFTNYTVGSPLVTGAEFFPAAQTAAATDISTDKRLIVVPASTSTSTSPATTSTLSLPFTFTSSKITAQGGDVVTLSANDSGGDAISKIEIFFDGTLVKSCLTISCSAEVLIPSSGTRSSYAAEARATKLSTEILSNTLTITTITIQADGSSLVSIRAGQSVILSGQQASAIATVDASIAVNRIDISVDGIFVKGCTGGIRQCQWSDVLSGATSSSHPVFAKVLDNFGRTYTSKTVTITIGTNDLPGVTAAAAKLTIYAGEWVDITVTATDNDGISWIEVMKDGNVLKRCDSAAPCTATTGPWNTVGTTLLFDGRAGDTKGNIGKTSESATVSVVTREK